MSESPANSISSLFKGGNTHMPASVKGGKRRGRKSRGGKRRGSRKTRRSGSRRRRSRK